MNETIEQITEVAKVADAADKPKRPHKRQNKAKQVRRLLAKGLTPKEIATKINVSPNYVYTIRWHANKTAGIASLKKHKVEETLGTDQIPYVQPADPPQNAYAYKEVSPFPPIKPTFWQRVRDFVGL
jgi:hypothetical protein